MVVILSMMLSYTTDVPNNSSSQRHTLQKRDYMHSISEVIIQNNDQHQYQQTTGLIKRLNNIQL